jgi:hypothetical protein
MNPLLKNILAAVLGYVVMVLAVFAMFSLMWLALGPSGAFEPGSWDVSDAWVAGSILLGLGAAVLGGLVCARVAVDHRGIMILIGLVLLLGILSAVPEAADRIAVSRPDDVSMMEAMTSAHQPGWSAWLNPVIGALGALLGWRVGSRRPASAI